MPSQDRDDDGVLEYAQKLISSEGKTDGLYWPADQGDGESPAGDLRRRGGARQGQGGRRLFRLRFRILTGQGDNIAGGAYDYVINGNMIAGFALVAWPVKYGETGVNTFVVNQHGIVYEADLGAGHRGDRQIHRPLQSGRHLAGRGRLRKKRSSCLRTISMD